jgi:hypothetical protein
MGSIPTILCSCLRHEDVWNFVRNGRAFGMTSKLILLYQYNNRRAEGTPDMNKRMNQHGHIKCCKWVPWQHLDGSWFALYFHRQRNIKFSFWRHILYWYNKINLLVMPKAQPLRTKFQKSSCRRHEHSIVGMDPMATHCRKLIVTGIYWLRVRFKFDTI